MKMLATTFCLGLGAILAVAIAPAAWGQPCQQPITDYGDAPECIPAYPGVIGHFPTCVSPCASAGTQESACLPPRSTAPAGPAGFVEHYLPAGAPHFWLGCFGSPGTPGGIDSEPDGKVNTPPVGFSACAPGLPTDCVGATPFALTFDQDECAGDGVDAGLAAQPGFITCVPSSITFTTSNCGSAPVQAVLNILVDWNGDGDWNDNFFCSDIFVGCVYEWAVKNVAIEIPPGCTSQTSPSIQPALFQGPAWLRITITQDPVPDDYPWNGSLSSALTGPDGHHVFLNGETEDYPAFINGHTPTEQRTWGEVKARYR